jgi:hypothetical protein
MAQLDRAHDTFIAARTEVLAIGPNALRPARIYFQRQPLKFPFLCDPTKETYLRYGLRDLGPIEANINTFRSFAYAYTHGDGINTTRIVADTFTEGFWSSTAPLAHGHAAGHVRRSRRRRPLRQRLQVARHHPAD